MSIDDWGPHFEDAPMAALRLADWMSVPLDEREPLTKRQLAEELGVSVTTLSRYQNSAEFPRLQHALGDAKYGVSEAAWGSIVDRVVYVAMFGDGKECVAAAKFIAEITGRSTPAQRNVSDASGMSDEELEAIVARHTEQKGA